jgi:methylphosphotriester-DNA--protein-cysteine methyltransferase
VGCRQSGCTGGLPLSAQFKSGDLPDFDAALQTRQSAPASLRQTADTQVSRFGFRSQYDSRLGMTFLWAKKGAEVSTLRSSLTGQALHEATAVTSWPATPAPWA